MEWIGFVLAGMAVTLAVVRLPAALLRAEQAEVAAWVAQRGAAGPDDEELDEGGGGSLRQTIATGAWAMPACVAIGCAAAAMFGPTRAGLAAAGLGAALLALSAIDLRHRLLPDLITLPLLWCGLLVNLGGLFVPLPEAVIGAVAGYLVLWASGALFRLWRGVDGMAQGDLKLLAALGAWTGWQAVPWIVAVAAVAGVAFALVLALSGRQRLDAPIPFGPCLALAGIALFCWPYLHGSMQ